MTVLATDLAWSVQQGQALEAVEGWRRRGDSPFFYLAGYAGTGKTTLAKEIGRRAGRTEYAAFTGKAAHVMRKKGCDGASTIHSLIYLSESEVSCAASPPCASITACRDGERCQFRRERFIGQTLNPRSDVAEADLVIIDESSMVSAQMGMDLLSFGTAVLALGDEAQLSPVKGAGFFTNREPDFALTEVHRQALGSPIIRLATTSREGRPLPCGQYGDSRVLAHASVDDMLAHDQILCGMNRTRHRINSEIRQKLGYGGLTPMVGEKLICLRNDRQNGLYNGSLWTVTRAV